MNEGTNSIAEVEWLRQQLAESEARYTALFTAAIDGICLAEADSGYIVECNEAMAELVGRTRAELIGQHQRILHPPADSVADFSASFHAHLAAQEGTVLETQVITRDGRIRDVEIKANRLQYLGKTVVQGQFHDITERKHAEDVLRQERSLLRSVLDASRDLIFFKDRQSVYLGCNRAFAIYSGLAEGELIGKTDHDVAAPETADFFRAQDRVTLTTGLPHRVEEWIPFAGGGQGLFDTLKTPICAPDGEVLGVLGISRDITERKQMEEALQESEERYRQLVDAAPDGILVFVDGRIVFVNPAGLRLHRASQPGDLVGKPVLDLVHPDFRAAIDTRLAVVGQGQSVQFLEQKLIRLDGTLFDAEVAGVPILYQGRPAVQAIVRDVSQRKQMEQALADERLSLARRVEERTADFSRANADLAHALRSKDEFLANMSHELRTPLTAILALAESLLEQLRGPLTDRQAESIRMIDQSGRHLLALINDILDLSKVEAGKLELELAFVPVDEVCQASLAFVREMANKKNLRVALQLDDSQARVQADPRRLKQILVNLLSNAVKFTPDGGQVSLNVTTHPAQSIVRFVVADNGIGIAPGDAARLFSPFTQLDSGLARRYEGSGLGLALVRRLVELHGGSVALESEGIAGRGSCFTVTLPWVPDDTAVLGLPAETEDRWDGVEQFAPAPNLDVADMKPLLLLAEDNAITSEAIGDYLRDVGYQMVIAHNGEEAIARTIEFLPDLILMDVQMPVLNGLDAIRRLRADARFATIPIIALTALAMPGDIERCLAAGADDYVPKPMSLKDMVEKIERWLRGSWSFADRSSI